MRRRMACRLDNHTMMKTNYAETIKFDAGNLSWMNNLSMCWSINLNDVVVIGEWIDDDGMSITTLSHKVAFLTRDRTCYNVSIDAEGFGTVSEKLKATLSDFVMDLQLFQATLGSRVLWPVRLRGILMFEFEPISIRSLADWVLNLFGNRYKFDLSKPVKDYLDAAVR